MHKVKIAILNDEYYVYVVWGKTREMIAFVNNYLCEQYGSNALDGFRGRVFWQEDTYPVICLNSRNTFWPTLAHEAVHAISYIFDEIGERSHGEVFAHSVGAILRGTQKYTRKNKLRI